jgi:hypothetical protein
LIVGDTLQLAFNSWFLNRFYAAQTNFITDTTGSFSVYQLRGDASCGDSLFIKTIVISDSLQEQPKSSDCIIDVSPNPGENFLQVKSTNGIEKLSVYDMQGKSIMEFEAKGKTQVSFEIPNLAAGTYLIQAQCVNQARHELKWMRR